MDATEAHKNALASFERAIALQSDFPEAWNNRGNSLVDLGKCEESDRCERSLEQQAPRWDNIEQDIQNPYSWASFTLSGGFF